MSPRSQVPNYLFDYSFTYLFITPTYLRLWWEQSMNPCMGAMHRKTFIYRVLRCIHAFIHQGRLTRNDQRCLCVGFKWSGRKTSASNPKDPTCALTHSLLKKKKKKDCLCQQQELTESPNATGDWLWTPWLQINGQLVAVTNSVTW